MVYHANYLLHRAYYYAAQEEHHLGTRRKIKDIVGTRTVEMCYGWIEITKM